MDLDQLPNDVFFQWLPYRGRLVGGGRFDRTSQVHKLRFGSVAATAGDTDSDFLIWYGNLCIIDAEWECSKHLCRIGRKDEEQPNDWPVSNFEVRGGGRRATKS